jgi:hypothetical protein
VNKHHFGKGSKDVELKLYTFLILSPNRDKWSVSRIGRLKPREIVSIVH